MASKIILTTKRKQILVSEEDYQYLSQFTWLINNDGYAATEKNKKYIQLHREVAKRMGFDLTNCGVEIDHKNSKKLDNTRENLRIATHAQNQWNRGKMPNNTSGEKNVFWSKKRQKWEIYVKKNGKKFWRGYFNTVEEASHAATLLREELHGEFANHGK